MTPYTRAAFADWLRTLPPDEPFCPPHLCPIAASPLELERGPYGRNIKAHDSDPYLTNAIDISVRVVKADDGVHFLWGQITPRQILLIIDELEAESDNRS